MKVVLLRVGIDTGSGGCLGPVFEDGRFEFVPIPENPEVLGPSYAPPTYGTLTGRHGRPFIEYLPERKRATMANTAAHVDPEFSTFTYGDPTKPKAGLRTLQPGDILAFYAGLEGWGCKKEPGLYLIGYFVVQVAGMANQFSDEDLQTLFGQNAHVRNPVRLARDRETLVLVKGCNRLSRLLQKAALISSNGQDQSGRILKVLSPPMRTIFGHFNGKVSIQRSPPRWVEPAYSDAATRFIQSLR